ncbi:MAG: DUF362 domain-containing protein [Desulfobacteraceae bacterium]|nr:DUF362 domain-containing protein [Desulfobacteraceae bacterium]
MSNVVWVDLEGMSFDNSVEQKLIRLLAKSDATGTLEEGMKVTLKVNTAEAGYEYGLRPSVVKIMAQGVYNKTKKIPVVCDGHKPVDYWKQSKGNTLLKVASARGYTSDTLGGKFVINGGYSGDESDLFSCGTRSTLGGVEIGTAICRSDAMWVVSHVTLHPLFGISGALLNSGFECLSGRAKTRILNGTSPYLFNGHSPSPKEIEAFMENAIECHIGVNNALEGRIFYINLLWDVTPQPEYYPYSDKPIMENMGFLASSDPVAIDSATLSIIETNNKYFDGTRTDFNHVIKRAENLGIGSSKQRLLRLS